MDKSKSLFVLSYGGGVNSSALFFHLLDTGQPLDLVIFADTGEEMPETYDAVHRMAAICKEKGIRFETVRSHHGRLADYYTRVRAVPSMMKRDCTGKFKVSPIRKFLRSEYPGWKFVLYIGIAWDEWTRMKESNVRYITHSYPFCDDRIDRRGNLAILERHGFPAAKSGCVGCIYNKRSAWLRMARDQPEEFARWETMEKGGKRYPQITLSNRYKLEDVRQEAKSQMTLTAYEPEPEVTCDVVNGGCFL